MVVANGKMANNGRTTADCNNLDVNEPSAPGRLEKMDELETRWQRLDTQIRVSLESIDLDGLSPPPTTKLKADPRSEGIWTLASFPPAARTDTPNDDEAVEHMVVGARQLKTDVNDLLSERSALREEVERERQLLERCRRDRLDAESTMAEMAALEAREASVAARELEVADIEELMRELERETEDLDARLDEASAREAALDAREAALGARADELARRERDAADQERAIESSVAASHEAAERLRAEASAMMAELDGDRATLKAREDRVINTEENLAALQDELTARNIDLMNLKEEVLAREASTSAAQTAADARMEQAEALELEALAWKQRSDDADAVLSEKDVVKRHAAALRAYNDALSEREYKLRESWKACATQAASLVDADDSALRWVLSEECTESIRLDAKLAEDLAQLSSPFPCATCARHETNLQRWAVNLALENNHLKARAERVLHEETRFKAEAAEAKANRAAAEALMVEIQTKEVEVNSALAVLENKEALVSKRMASTAEGERDLESARGKMAVDAGELRTRTRALKSLEQRWESRHAEVVQREHLASDMQRRMMEQRKALEMRELAVHDDEERIRVEAVELAAKRLQLRGLEEEVRRRARELGDREQDATRLHVEARKGLLLVDEFEREMSVKFASLSHIALQLEQREELVSASGDLMSL